MFLIFLGYYINNCSKKKEISKNEEFIDFRLIDILDNDFFKILKEICKIMY